MSKVYSKWRPHPWHGLSPGPDPPSEVHVFIEITPFDLVKYEVDKESGYLRVDRSQKTSSLPPALYGFIPKTYAGERVAALMPGVSGGDGDPLDICVLSERPISRAEVILRATVVGGIPMEDGGLADDKIIGILQDDPVLGSIRQLEDLPDILVGRLIHYFSTYKLRPAPPETVVVGKPYGREHAHSVIAASLEDYAEIFVDGAPPDGRGHQWKSNATAPSASSAHKITMKLQVQYQMNIVTWAALEQLWGSKPVITEFGEV